MSYYLTHHMRFHRKSFMEHQLNAMWKRSLPYINIVSSLFVWNLWNCVNETQTTACNPTWKNTAPQLTKKPLDFPCLIRFLIWSHLKSTLSKIVNIKHTKANAVMVMFSSIGEWNKIKRGPITKYSVAKMQISQTNTV